MSAPYRPTSAEALSEILRDEELAHVVASGSLSWSAGQVPQDIAPIETTSLCGVVEHAAHDMTITLGAGTSWSNLRNTLGTAGQEFPIETNCPNATIGGLIARNYFGPRAWSAGKWRDRVLGIECVDGIGRRFRSGGRVVKNVAGYDITKALIGSFGTLGIVTEVTLKVQPASALSTYRIDFASLKDIDAIWSAAVAGRLAIASLGLHGQDGNWRASVSIEGTGDSRNDLRLKQAVTESNLPVVAVDRVSDSGVLSPQYAGTLHASVPLSKWLAIAEDLSTTLGGTIAGWLGGPIIWTPTEPLTEENLHRFANTIEKGHGWWRFDRPRDWLSTSGLPSATKSNAPSAQLMSALRKQFDPRQVFYDFGLGWTSASL